MVKAWIILVGLVLATMYACSSRPYPEEKPFLREPPTEKYWLCNMVTDGPDSLEEHHCLLLTHSPSELGTFTSFFLSRWNAADSLYQFGTRLSNNAVWSKKGKWPLVASVPGDSVTPDWRFYWGRKAIWLEGEVNGMPLQLRGEHPYGKRFFTRQLHDNPDVFSIQSFTYDYRGDNEPDAKIDLLAFVDASNLVNSDYARAIYCITLHDFSGDGVIILKMDPQGGLSLMGQDYSWRHGGGYHNPFATIPDAIWQSPHSHKSYSLGIQYAMEGEKYLVRPRIQDQEIRAGRNSFWMGAVEVVRVGNGSHFASGNMYIFTR
jgi:hypothetical protein